MRDPRVGKAARDRRRQVLDPLACLEAAKGLGHRHGILPDPRLDGSDEGVLPLKALNLPAAKAHEDRESHRAHREKGRTNDERHSLRPSEASFLY